MLSFDLSQHPCTKLLYRRTPDNCLHDVALFPYLKHVPGCSNPHLLQSLVTETVKALLIHLSRDFVVGSLYTMFLCL